MQELEEQEENVSTRSRPKAAGPCLQNLLLSFQSFNTQPPEGGWILLKTLFLIWKSFNTQPPEGGWVIGFYSVVRKGVSTRSRPKAAG